MSTTAPIPPDEHERLALMQHLGLLDTPAEPELDELVALAARLLDTPFVAVNLIAEDRLWTKAAVGVDQGTSFPRSASFCTHALTTDGTLVVPDATADPRFAANPFVSDGSVRFYAGAPVQTAEGVTLGTLCVADDQPRQPSAGDLETLRVLAGAVSAHIEQRRQRLLAEDRAAELATILEQAPDAFLTVDVDGRIGAWNREAHRLLGWSTAEAVGTPVTIVVSPEHHAEVTAAVSAGDHERGSQAHELTLRHRDGHEVPVELTVAVLERRGTVRFAVFARDVGERREREREREDEAVALTTLGDITSRLAAATLGDDLPQTIAHGAVTVAGADEAFIIGDVRGTLRVTGSTIADFLGLEITDDTPSLAARSFQSGEPLFVSDAAGRGFPLADRAGARTVVIVPIRAEGQVVGALAALWRTVLPQLTLRAERLLGLVAHEAGTAIARDRLMRGLTEQSRTDGLTGIPNRRALDEELERARARADRSGEPLSVIMLDLDRFKSYNDTRGHGAGDELLATCAAAWRDTLRAGDVIARYGGEEFCAVLPSCEAGDAVALAERLRALVPSGQTCSAGVATWDRAEPIDALVSRADRALYSAKSGGRDAVCVA